MRTPVFCFCLLFVGVFLCALVDLAYPKSGRLILSFVVAIEKLNWIIIKCKATECAIQKGARCHISMTVWRCIRIHAIGCAQTKENGQLRFVHKRVTCKAGTNKVTDHAFSNLLFVSKGFTLASVNWWFSPRVDEFYGLAKQPFVNRRSANNHFQQSHSSCDSNVTLFLPH